MRCPKCGYISFDHLDTCLKCNKDIKSVSDALQGAVYNVAAPSFLKFDVSEQADEGLSEMDAFVADGGGIDEMEIEDPDLDILVDDADEGETGESEIDFQPDEEGGFTLDFDDDDEGGIEINLEDGQEEGEMTLDFGDAVDEQEETFSGFDESESVETDDEPGEFTLDLPDELNDMSDLERPTEVAAAPAGESDAVAGLDDGGDELGLDLDFDLDLGGDDLESPLGDLEDSGGPIAQKGGLDDDFDLGSLEIEEPAPAQSAAPKEEKKQGSAKLNLDEELDFDLDLGDLNFDDK